MPPLPFNCRIVKPRRFLDNSFKNTAEKISFKPFAKGMVQTSQTSKPDLKDAPTAFDAPLHIHGLNKCFLEHIEKTFKVNPTGDLSGTFDTYRNHLQEIMSKSQNGNLDSKSPAVLQTTDFNENINMSVQREGPATKNDSKSLLSFNTLVDKPASNFSFLSPASASTVSSEFTSEKPPFSFALNASEPAQKPFSFMKPSSEAKSLFSLPSSTSASGSIFSFLTADKPDFSSTEQAKNAELEKEETGHGEEEEDEPVVIEEVDPCVKGPGEESDTVIFALKCKVYVMALSQSDKTWQDLGVASLRINETSCPDSAPKQRIIARAQGSTSKLLLNSYASGISLMPLKPSEKSVSFISLNPEEKLTCYLIRAKTEQSLHELYSHLEKYSRKELAT